MAEVVQQRTTRSALADRRAGMARTLEDLHAMPLRAGPRREGLSNFRVTSAAAGQHTATPPTLDHLSKQSRIHSHAARHGGSRLGCPYDPPAGDGKSRAAENDDAFANVSSTSVWVWGQEPQASAGTRQHRQKQQVTQGVTAAGPGVTPGDGDDGTNNPSVAERKKMFADVKSSSSCSTVDLTASESGSNKANSPTCVATLDDSFWNQLSEFSVRFPEPPTRVPTPAPSNSTALAISGWGKNITSTLPPRWRKRLRAAGTQKRFRKSSTRWIARSKATSSMSESCVFARAVSISDGTSHHHRQWREKEVGVASVAEFHESAPAAVSHEPAPAVVEAIAEVEKPSEFEVVAEVSERSAPELVELPEDKEEEEQQPQQQQQEQQRQLELQHEELERQLQQLEQHQQKLEQQQRQLEQQWRLQQQQEQKNQQQQQQHEHEHRAGLSALPMPVVVHALPSTPPPAPLWTAPRPPLSRQQTPLAARYPLCRTARYFGSVSSQGSASESNRRSPAPSPCMKTSRTTMKNRLASSGSSIFEEDGDDSKKTKWLNPYTLSPAAPGAAPVAATAAAPAAAACNPYVRGACDTPRTPNAGKDAWAGATPSPSSPARFWRGRSPRTPNADAVATQQQQQQQQRSMFETRAGWGRMRRDAAVRALAAEINRRDARIYGDQRRRVRNGESGIWLQPPGIWSSGRRPTPLSSDSIHAW